MSVVTTVFNGIEHFDKAIPSILSQTYKNFEWIIVDDGSTDGTLEKLNEIKNGDSRINIISNGKMGRTKALNFAISQAESEYIFQQDFDDVSHPRRIELQLEYLKNNPKVGVLGGYYELSNEIRKENFLRKPPLDFESIKKSMSKYIPICHTIASFRKSAWESCGGYDENYNDIIDLRFYIEVINNGWEVANIPENLGIHYVYSNSNYIKANKYSTRQKNFRNLNIKAIKDFGLPSYCYFFVMGRYFYYRLPPYLKRFIRRGLSLSKEEEI